MGESADLPGGVSVERPLLQGTDRACVCAREAIAGKDARTLARDILAMSDEDFRTAFKGSPMKRAKLRGLKRNTAVVLGNLGDLNDADVLMAALDDPETIVREPPEWALQRPRPR